MVEFYLFKSCDFDLRSEYYQGASVTDIFLITSNGVKTNRDKLLIDCSPLKLTKRIEDLADYEYEDSQIKDMYGLEDNPYWNTKRERINIIS